MKKEKKQLHLSLRQLIGILILAVLIALTITALSLIDRSVDRQAEQISYLTEQTDSFLLSLKQKESINRQYAQRYKKEEVEIRLAPFDPNTADSLLLRQLGLKGWQARTLIHYRSAGARFKQKEDMKKLFFMNDSMYNALEPYIQIEPLTEDSTLQDTLRHTFYHEKKDTILELNSADTASLRLIRGIGRYTAVKIVNRRERLGGFVSVEQLREIDNIQADSLIKHFVVDTTLVKTIDLNHCSVERLAAHPYINFEQAKQIYTLRRSLFRLKSKDQILTSGILTEEEYKKVAPYLKVE